MLEAVDTALRFSQLLKESPRSIEPAVQTELFRLVRDHNRYYYLIGGSLTGKHHLMYHAVSRMAQQGNLRYVHTYRDEHFNGVIAQICRGVHGLTFYRMVFARAAVLRSVRRDAPWDGAAVVPALRDDALLALEG